ncbi:MAG: bifunctional non-ous end joining protein LigD [Solirubrobacteraceae bacterium]|nr:bifunctional non-ous end joining protein LigD [Solirubrobacteraceae bacterium]
MPRSQRLEVDVDGHRLSLSNLDKVLYPAVGFTKGQVIDYYTRIAPAVLPHLRDRPLTLKRYPNGVEGSFFYEKNAPSHRPAWVRAERVRMRATKAIDFVVCDDLPTLVWLANLADLELHPSLATVGDVTAPTILAFDLDPGEGTTIVECAEVAVRLRLAMDQLGLQCFPKTSGSKGMQVYVPLNTGGVTYDVTKPFARAIAQVLERAEPDLVVSDMAKQRRRGKVFVDWSQNDEHKTTVGVYSLRAREHPTVSTPLDWSEVEAVLESRDPRDLVFTSNDVLARVAEHGDRFAPVATLQQQLPSLA